MKIKKMKLRIISFIIVSINCACSLTNTDPLVEEVGANNFKINLYHVTTKDGYILSLYNMPPKTTNSCKQSKPKVMFFAHCIMSSSGEFIVYNDSAAYFFAEQGYDVWLGNSRGIYLNPNHTKFDSNSAEYWSFSWHELGVFDLPAQIDYILEKTKQNQLSYVGHSQGVTAGFVLLSELPEYNDKIKIFHAMAPPIIMKHFSHPLISPFVPIRDFLLIGTERLKIYNLAPHLIGSILIEILGEFCKFPLYASVCEVIFSLFDGRSAPNSWYPEIVIDISRFHPAGCGYRLIMHYAQIISSGTFQKFDYGRNINLKLYGTGEPPRYNLKNIRTNVHLIYGTNDNVVLEKNIPMLINELKNAKVIVSALPSFNHMDFVFGRQVLKAQQTILNIENRFG